MYFGNFIVIMSVLYMAQKSRNETA